MGIESNKVDFEKALEEMKETIILLGHSVDEGLMDSLKAVVSEYEVHFSSDIEEVIDYVSDLEERLQELDASDSWA